MVVSKFIVGVKEIEFDGVVCNGEIVVFVISEYVENVGVYLGDVMLVLLLQCIYLEIICQVRLKVIRIVVVFYINGLFNVQFVVCDNKVMVIECNL